MQKQEELNKVWKFINTFYHSTFLIKKPSWLQYYCLCQNECIAYSTSVAEKKGIFVAIPDYTIEYHKKLFGYFESPNKKQITKLYKDYYG